MGYLDPSLLSSSIDSAKCRVPAYAMAYINAMENGVDCDGPYNKLRSMIYMIKILECVQTEPPGEGPVIPGPEPCPDCPECPECPELELNEVRALFGIESTGLDPSNCNVTILMFDQSGTFVSSDGGSGLDLTDPAQRATLLSQITSALDVTYGVTSSGTIDVIGTTVYIDISGTGNIPIPTPSVTICIYDSTIGVSIPIILS